MNRMQLEPLEGRRLLTITPGHLALAERSVAEVTPDTNLYSNGNPAVTWKGLNGATATTVTADCTTYVTVLLKQAYAMSNSKFTSLFGVSSPSLTRYYDQAAADGALDGFKEIAGVKPGDLFISKYADTSTALGHMVIIETTPQLVSVGSQYKAYTATVIDVTGSPHSNDTRDNANADGTDDSGVGRGTLRFYTDLSGNLDHWAWGAYATSTTYTAADRPCLFAKVPALSIGSPTNFKASVPDRDTGVVKLAWTDNSAIEDGFVVQRSDDNGSTWSVIGDVTSSVTGYVDSTVPKAGTYRYRVYAVAGSSQSSGQPTTSVKVKAVTRSGTWDGPTPIDTLPMPTPVSASIL